MTKKEAKPQPEAAKSTEEMILNYQLDKYCVVPLAALWAKELRRKEEHRHLTANEILDLALRDVLSGKVDWKSLKKALAASAAGNGGLLGSAAGEGEAKKPKE